MPHSFDALRAARPDLGFAVYAIEPDADVTLEVHVNAEQVFSFTAPTFDEAVELAFPPQSEPQAPSTDIFD